MTNSTVKAEEKMSSSTQQPKGQGAIRSGAILPIAIGLVLTWSYFHFFFDAHLRRGLEYGGTQLNGAEVDIGDVESSFWNGALVVHDIQVTDSAAPSRNLLRLGTVSLHMLWDGLLRGKVVIDHAEVLGVQLHSPRSSPGRLLPADANGPLTDKVLANVKEQFDGNVLGDLASIAEGADPTKQLGDIGDELKSSARIVAIQKDLAQKEKEWKGRIAALPKSEDFRLLEQRLHKVKLDRFKNVGEIQSSVKELTAIRDAVNGHVAKVKDTRQSLGKDVNRYKNIQSELDRVVKQDVSDLQAHFRIPQLDAKTLANALFGPEMFGRVTEARGYMEKARAYMPPKRSSQERSERRLQPHERADGRNYAFGRPNAYPLFWLKRAEITSQSGESPYAGDLHGEIRDVTTDAPLVGRPTVATLQGDFPGQGIFGTRFELLLDHTTEAPVERLNASVERYAVAGRPLISSDAVNLGFEKASAAATFFAELQDDKVDLRLNNDFTQVGYQVAAKSPTAEELVRGALSSVPTVTVTGRVTGTWNRLDWYLATNLADELEQGFRRQVQAKVDEARGRIRAMVDERISGERKKLQQQYVAVEASVKKQLAAKQAEVNKLQAEINKMKARVELEKRRLIKDQEQKLKKGAEDLLKKALKLN